MATAMPVIEIELPVDRVSIARLHGEACIKCGSTVLPLMPNGHIETRGSEGGVLSWPVVACPDCSGSGGETGAVVLSAEVQEPKGQP